MNSAVSEVVIGQVVGAFVERVEYSPWGGVAIAITQPPEIKARNEEQAVEASRQNNVDAIEHDYLARERDREVELELPVKKIRLSQSVESMGQAVLSAVGLSAIKGDIAPDIVGRMKKLSPSGRMLVAKALADAAEARSERAATLSNPNNSGSILSRKNQTQNIAPEIEWESILNFGEYVRLLNHLNDVDTLHKLSADYPHLLHESIDGFYLILPSHMQSKEDGEVIHAHSNKIDEIINGYVEHQQHQEELRHEVAHELTKAIEEAVGKQEVAEGVYALQAGEDTLPVRVEVGSERTTAFIEPGGESDLGLLLRDRTDKLELKLVDEVPDAPGADVATERLELPEADLVVIPAGDKAAESVAEVAQPSNIEPYAQADVVTANDAGQSGDDISDYLAAVDNVEKSQADIPEAVAVNPEAAAIDMAETRDVLPPAESTLDAAVESAAPVNDVLPEVTEASAEALPAKDGNESDAAVNTGAEQPQAELEDVKNELPAEAASPEPQIDFEALLKQGGEALDSVKTAAATVNRMRGHFNVLTNKNSGLFERLLSAANMAITLPQLLEHATESTEKVGGIINKVIDTVNGEGKATIAPHNTKPAEGQANPYGWENYAKDFAKSVARGKDEFHYDYAALEPGLYAIGMPRCAISVGEGGNVTLMKISAGKNADKLGNIEDRMPLPSLQKCADSWSILPASEDDAWMVIGKISPEDAVKIASGNLISDFISVGVDRRDVAAGMRTVSGQLRDAAHKMVPYLETGRDAQYALGGFMRALTCLRNGNITGMLACFNAAVKSGNRMVKGFERIGIKPAAIVNDIEKSKEHDAPAQQKDKGQKTEIEEAVAVDKQPAKLADRVVGKGAELAADAVSVAANDALPGSGAVVKGVLAKIFTKIGHKVVDFISGEKEPDSSVGDDSRRHPPVDSIDTAQGGDVSGGDSEDKKEKKKVKQAAIQEVLGADGIPGNERAEKEAKPPKQSLVGAVVGAIAGIGGRNKEETPAQKQGQRQSRRNQKPSPRIKNFFSSIVKAFKAMLGIDGDSQHDDMATIAVSANRRQRRQQALNAYQDDNPHGHEKNTPDSGKAVHHDNQAPDGHSAGGLTDGAKKAVHEAMSGKLDKSQIKVAGGDLKAGHSVEKSNAPTAKTQVTEAHKS